MALRSLGFFQLLRFSFFIKGCSFVDETAHFDRFYSQDSIIKSKSIKKLSECLGNLSSGHLERAFYLL